MHVDRVGPMNQSQTETHLGSGNLPVVLGDEDFTESALSEELLFENDNLVRGDFHLIELALPPCPASFRQRFPAGQGDGPLPK